MTVTEQLSRFSLSRLGLVALLTIALVAPALAADTNGLGFSVIVDQAPVASHARMQSPACSPPRA